MTFLIHAILVLIGLVLIIIGIHLFLTSRHFRNTGVKTMATVIENIALQSRDNEGTSVMYAPLLECIVKGEKKTYTPNARSNPPAYHIGEKVAIVYSPENYQNVRIVSYWGIFLGSNILLGMGLPMFLIGAGYFLFKCS